MIEKSTERYEPFRNGGLGLEDALAIATSLARLKMLTTVDLRS